MISHLGPYKISEQIGAGAMGEVYLAEDTRLGRKVAIKVLPAELADQPKRIERFEREAKAAAALNHPHIATVFDVGFEAAPESGAGSAEGAAEQGLHFIVQEYLDGETLRRHLERRSLSLERTLRIAVELSDALAAAHDAGIVHRDLKPDNVFLTAQGHVKVLDFGLAKLTDDGSTRREPSLSTTLTDSASGRIVGTPGYMAPEQVSGESSDSRADIFAFGALLYEMTTGEKAFDGRSAAECLAQIAHQEPTPLEQINAELPLELQRIIHKCLQKDPLRRYQTAADLCLDLRALRIAVEQGSTVSLAVRAAADSAPGSRLGTLGLPALVVTAVLAAVITWASMSQPLSEPPPVLRFSVNLPEGVEITRTERPVVAMSRDGWTIAVAADRALWLRRLAEDDFQLLPGSSSSDGGYAVAPAFSPDGEHLAFFLDDAIRRVPLAGGAPRTLINVEMPSSIHWGEDGFIYYTQGSSSAEQAFESEGIWRVAEDGGDAEQVVAVDDDRRAAAPQLLAGNEWLLYSTTTAGDFVMEDSSTEEIVVQSLRTGERRTVLDGGFAGRYVDTGHILYLEQSSLWALPFNLDGLETTGGATQMIPSVPMSFWAGTPYMGIADNGNLVVPALALLQTRNGEVSWVVDDGEATPLGVPLADNPRITDDGTKVAVEVREVDDTRVWVHEIDRNSWTELTPSSSSTAPVWSPDGHWIYYMAADTDGHEAVFRKSADFTTPAERLWRPANHVPYPESMPADGRFLVYSAALGDQNDIWLLWLDGDRRAVPLIETTEISEEGAQVHPSGRWIAYTSALSDRDEVYVQELSEEGSLGRRYPISRSGGSEPMWSPDGRFLYYRYGALMICVEVTTEPEFRTGEPRVLMREFPGDYPVLRADYDIGPDGRFITAVPLVDWSWQRLDVVVNWFAESGLRR